MKFLLIICLLSLSAFAHEKKIMTRAEGFASAHYSSQRNHPWPYPLLSIGHNMQSYQDYSNSPYWHDGLDIRATVDQAIYAAAGGKIVNIENYIKGNALYWEIAILDSEGFVWKYHHVDQKSIPADIHAAYKSGTIIESGTLLGNVVRWPISSFGERYHHLHLLVVAADKKYINPFLMMESLPDTKSPVINSIGLAQKHKPLLGKKSVKGAHSLYLDASDLVLHEKFILPPHKISYKLDGAEEVLVWEFIHLPSATNDEDYISDFYMKGTCGDYSCRKFYFNLLFTTAAPRQEWTLPQGEHEIEVTVSDLLGNTATSEFNWQVLA